MVWLSGGGMVAAAGYAMHINMMATREWPFFAIGFALAAISQHSHRSWCNRCRYRLRLISTFLNKVAGMVAELHLVQATQSAYLGRSLGRGALMAEKFNYSSRS